MRLTTRTDLAARILMYCALNPDRPARSPDIARACNASPHHVLHVVGRLGDSGFVETLRGRGGGIRLARPPAAISLGEVVRALEGDSPVTECMGGACSCPLTPDCRLRGVINRALEAFHHELDQTSLADLVSGNHGLAALLRAVDSGRPTRPSANAAVTGPAPARERHHPSAQAAPPPLRRAKRL